MVAIGYSSQLARGALALGALGIASVRGMALLGIRSIPLYFLVGAAIWLAVDASGIHATITGVVLGLLTPTGRWVSDDRLQAILDRVVADPSEDRRTDMAEGRKAWRLTEVAIRETLSPVERLDMMLHPWVSFAIMPLFALANAGMPLSVADLGSPVTFAVFVGFTIGKPVGILTFGWLAVRSGLASRPPELGWGMLAGGGLLAGIGFTMAVFIADLASHDALIDAAKLGILSASVVSAAVGLAVLAWSTTSKRGDGNGEVRFAAITRADGTARLELSDGEGKSRFEVATLADGPAALGLGDPEEKRRFGVIAKANGFARLSTPLHRDAASRGNKDRAV